jgi:hypothetical protein
MPFWRLHPTKAQNQFRLGLSPQPQLAEMRRQAFGFGLGIFFYVSYGRIGRATVHPLWGVCPIYRVTTPMPTEFPVKPHSFSGFVFMC